MADIKVKVLDEDAPEVKVKSEAPQEEEVKVEEKTQDSVEETQKEPEKEQVEEVKGSEEKKEEPEVEAPVVKDEVREEPQKDVLSNSEEKQVELPEDVKSFLKFKEETGRGMDDYVKLNVNYDEMNESDLLRQYIKEDKPHFDEEDISFYIESNFISKDDDDDNIARKKKLDLKETIYKAKKHFNSLKDNYYTPVESTEEVPEKYKKAFSFYSEYQKDQEKQDILTKKRGQYFVEQTDKLYNQIEGFEFDLGDSKQVYKINDKDSAKKQTASLTKFVNKFLDNDGYIKDTAGYHRAMTIASQPDQFAKYFYELGKASAVDGIVKETKNIDMTVKANTGQTDDGRTKFRVVDSGSGSSLRVKKRN
tara:strand:+ start:10143 stop:11234 length:1092 start_codon:yes stop_codon:yes gene_type:complete